MNLLLLTYNNYHNRLYKRETNIVDYTDESPSSTSLLDVNFNPDDGVNTTHVIGKGSISNEYDYLVVYDNSDNIVSR